MHVMSKKRLHNRHTQPRESFHLPTELLDAMKRYMDSMEVRPGKSEVIRTALERLLTERGFWPPRKN